MWILCSVWKMIFPSIRRSISYKHNFIEQKRKYVIFLDIGDILEKGVHESSVCDTGVDFLISTFLSNSHSKFPTIWTIFSNSQLHLTISFCLFNSLILQYLPHVTHFPKSLPLSHFPTNRCQLSLLSIRSFLFAVSSTFISNSADGLVSGEVLCDTLRLVWCVCVRPSLYPPQWFPDIT